jgi:hypothetical protein
MVRIAQGGAETFHDWVQKIGRSVPRNAGWRLLPESLEARSMSYESSTRGWADSCRSSENSEGDKREELTSNVWTWGKPRVTARSRNPQGLVRRRRRAALTATQDSRTPSPASSRGRKREGGWPGNQTVSQGDEGQDPKGKPQGSMLRPTTVSRNSDRGTKP